MRRWWVLALLAGCNGTGDDGTASTDTDDPGFDPAALTWSDDIGPIYAARCVGCHQEGGLGPFALDDAASAQAWAEPSAAAVQSRTMPPYLVRDDGTCGDFADGQWLTEEEVGKIVAWAEHGAPAGDASAVFPPADRPVLDTPDRVLTLPEFTPEIVGGTLAENDEYRCFMLENSSQEDWFVTGYEVVPGNEAIVHHVLMMPVALEGPSWFNGKTNAQVIAQLDDASPDRDGWPCFGAAGDGVREGGFPVTWAPGQGAVLYPEGVGYRIRPGDALVAQVHYNLFDPAHRGESDQSAIHLRTAATVEREGWFALPDDFLDSLGGFPQTIPAGEEDYRYSFRISASALLDWGGLDWGDVDHFELYGVMPHMHQLGAHMDLQHVAADGEKACAAEVPRWDFNWQRFYFYEQPLRLEEGDELKVSCFWDASEVAGPTYPGWGTGNEMCLMGMFFVRP